MEQLLHVSMVSLYESPIPDLPPNRGTLLFLSVGIDGSNFLAFLRNFGERLKLDFLGRGNVLALSAIFQISLAICELI